MLTLKCTIILLVQIHFSFNLSCAHTYTHTHKWQCSSHSRRPGANDPRHRWPWTCPTRSASRTAVKHLLTRWWSSTGWSRWVAYLAAILASIQLRLLIFSPSLPRSADRGPENFGVQPKVNAPWMAEMGSKWRRVFLFLLQLFSLKSVDMYHIRFVPREPQTRTRETPVNKGYQRPQKMA